MSFLAFTVDFRAFSQLSQSNPYSRRGEQNIAISFSTPHCTKIGQYDRLEMENCSFVTNPGQPMLPIRTVVMKLPERSSILDVNVKIREAQLEGIFYVLPAPSPSIVGSQLPEDFSEDATIYASESFFPEEWYTFREGHGLDAEINTRVKYVIFGLFPLRFLPAEKRVTRAVDISIKVSYVEELPLTTPSSIKNLIITSPDFETYALQLAQWKNQTGVSSRAVNTTWIYHNYGGIDHPEQIRTCIKDFVASYGILYVTVFGDADVVPVRYAYVPDGEDTYTPTDLYYADLDGTWDDNNDQLYADQRYDNVDGIPDVYVGRIPPSLTSYAQVAVDKIIGYQSQFNASQSWTRRVVLAAGTGSGDGISNPFGMAFPFLKNYTATLCSGNEIVKLYESYGNLSATSMSSQINQGSLFANFAGHGASGLWLFYWIFPLLDIYDSYEVSDVQALTNGYRLPVVTTMSCSTAEFDVTDCIGEWFVLEPGGGAIGYFGSTRIAWGYSDEWIITGLMGEMDWRVYQNYYEGFTRLGQMWGESVSEYVQSHVWDYESAWVKHVKTFMEFVLLGDPTIRIYNQDYPETLNVPEDCATIQGAINAAYDGDTILVSSGTYYEHVVVNKTVTLSGENQENTILKVQWADGNMIGMQIVGTNATISGFTITYNISPTVLVVIQGHHNTIRGNILIQNTGTDTLVVNGGTNNTLTDNLIVVDEGSTGIGLISASFNLINNNTVTGGWGGIVLISSTNNVIMNNIVGNQTDTARSYDGTVALQFSSGNTFYHNSFLNDVNRVYVLNSVNLWDNGYPSGGNYWSNYVGSDLLCGPFQNITGCDGICDAPYVIDANNQDKYPLRERYPWRPSIGDVNGDRAVNVYDILAVKSRWGTTPASPDWTPEYDCNDDDTINVFDILTIKANWGKSW
jgi:parallel beta-helix repeat protein